jgi:hypothetical protein
MRSMRLNAGMARGAAACAAFLTCALACSSDPASPAFVADGGGYGSNPALDGSEADVAEHDGAMIADGATDRLTVDGRASDSPSPEGAEAGSVFDGSSTTDPRLHDGSASANDAAHAVDAFVADATLPVPAPADLCSTMDAIWGNVARSDANSWSTEIIKGPPGPPTLLGFENVQDCRLADFYLSVANYTGWESQMFDYEYQIFGCPVDDAAISFGLVPVELSSQVFTTADLQLIGDWYVQSVVQAVANEGGLLTSDQIDQIEAQVAYSETMFSPQVDSTENHFSTCPDAAAAPGGSD